MTAEMTPPAAPAVRTLVLTLRHDPGRPVDARHLSPDRCQGLSLLQIGDLLLVSGNRTSRVEELFTLDEQPGADPGAIPDLVIRGPRKGLGWLDRLGQGMTAGRLRVEGDCGAYAGQSMKGGHLDIRGHAGAYAASDMRGGELHILKDADVHLGGVQPGSAFGMRGGVVVVRGNVGPRAADRMRRGLIVVGGNAAEQCGYRMVAGTLVVGGDCGDFPGFNLLHGTLICTRPPSRLLATFGDSGMHRFGFLPLLARHLQPLHPGLATRIRRADTVRRWAGDLALGGRGEILILES